MTFEQSVGFYIKESLKGLPLSKAKV